MKKTWKRFFNFFENAPQVGLKKKMRRRWICKKNLKTKTMLFEYADVKLLHLCTELQPDQVWGRDGHQWHRPSQAENSLLQTIVIITHGKDTEET